METLLEDLIKFFEFLETKYYGVLDKHVYDSLATWRAELKQKLVDYKKR